MSTTPNRHLPLMESSQAQPEVDFNLAMEILDLGTSLEVEASGASPGVRGTTKIKFLGATVTEESGGVAVVTIDSSTGGGSLTVDALTNTTLITFVGPAVSVAAGATGEAVVTIDLVSGGSSGGGAVNVDSHPAIEDVVNDEFEQSGSAIDTTGGRFSGATAWAGFNVGTTTTLQKFGSLYLKARLSASRNYSGYSQPLSGATWEYTCKFSQQAPNTNSLPGMFLATASGTAGNISVFAISGSGFIVQHLSNVTTFSANAFIGGSYASVSGGWPWVYLQIAFDGTTISYNVSPTGMPGSFLTVFSETPGAFIGTPTVWGLGNDNESGTLQSVGVYDWARKTA